MTRTSANTNTEAKTTQKTVKATQKTVKDTQKTVKATQKTTDSIIEYSYNEALVNLKRAGIDLRNCKYHVAKWAGIATMTASDDTEKEAVRAEVAEIYKDKTTVSRTISAGLLIAKHPEELNENVSISKVMELVGKEKALATMLKNSFDFVKETTQTIRTLAGYLEATETPFSSLLDKAKSKTEAKPETKPEAKPETKPEAKPETKPEAKPEALKLSKEGFDNIAKDRYVTAIRVKLAEWIDYYGVSDIAVTELLDILYENREPF